MISCQLCGLKHRFDLECRYLTLGPARMDIGFAGREPPAASIHRAVANLRSGDHVVIKGRIVHSREGQVVGRLAASVGENPLEGATASVIP